MVPSTIAKPYARVHWGHLSGSRSEVSQSCRLWPLGCLGAEHSPIAPSPLLRARSWLHPFKGHCEQQAMRDEGVIYVAGHPLLNRRCTRLPGCIRLRNDLGYIVSGGALNSAHSLVLFLHRKADTHFYSATEGGRLSWPITKRFKYDISFFVLKVPLNPNQP